MEKGRTCGSPEVKARPKAIRRGNGTSPGKWGEKARPGPCGQGLGAGDEAGLDDQTGADLVDRDEREGAGGEGLDLPDVVGVELALDDGGGIVHGRVCPVPSIRNL
jgi:hypothetical protein